MNDQALRTTHPAILVAAAAVTLLCAAGIAAIFGWIPGRGAGSAVPIPAAVAVAQPAPVDREQPVAADKRNADVREKAEIRAAPAARRPAAAEKHTAHPVAQAPAAAAPVPQPVQPPVASLPPPPPSVRPEISPPAESPRIVCAECGTVESVREVEKAGEATGLGAVGGVVAGGVLGNQVGGGRGRDVLTVLGAVGGAIAGHQIEKKVRATRQYQITVRFEDGSTRVITQDAAPAWRAGDRVKMAGGAIQPNM